MSAGTQSDHDEDDPDARTLGRRELNKRRIRTAIRDAAKHLFLERGFDGVSVAEIAQQAGVTEKTAFNYFPTKEDLVYSEMDHWEERMVAAIRDRASDETALDAFRDFIAEPSGLLAGSAQDRETLTRLTHLVLSTPSLLAREARTIDRYTNVLADTIAGESGFADGDPRAWIAANAMMGVHRALLDHVRHGIAAGRTPKRLTADVRRIATQGCAQLEHGISDLGRA